MSSPCRECMYDRYSYQCMECINNDSPLCYPKDFTKPEPAFRLFDDKPTLPIPKPEPKPEFRWKNNFKPIPRLPKRCFDPDPMDDLLGRRSRFELDRDKPLISLDPPAFPKPLPNPLDDFLDPPWKRKRFPWERDY